MITKDEAEALRLALICGSASAQEVKDWATAQIGGAEVFEPALLDVVVASDRISELITVLARVPGHLDGNAVASALARRLLASVKRDPARAEAVAAHIAQIVTSGEWSTSVPIDINWITDGFALAQQGIWPYDQALSNLKVALTKVSRD